MIIEESRALCFSSIMVQRMRDVCISFALILSLSLSLSLSMPRSAIYFFRSFFIRFRDNCARARGSIRDQEIA